MVSDMARLQTQTGNSTTHLTPWVCETEALRLLQRAMLTSGENQEASNGRKLSFPVHRCFFRKDSLASSPPCHGDPVQGSRLQSLALRRARRQLSLLLVRCLLPTAVGLHPVPVAAPHEACMACLCHAPPWAGRLPDLSASTDLI